MPGISKDQNRRLSQADLAPGRPSALSPDDLLFFFLPRGKSRLVADSGQGMAIIEAIISKKQIAANNLVDLEGRSQCDPSVPGSGRQKPADCGRALYPYKGHDECVDRTEYLSTSISSRGPGG